MVVQTRPKPTRPAKGTGAEFVPVEAKRREKLHLPPSSSATRSVGSSGARSRLDRALVWWPVAAGRLDTRTASTSHIAGLTERRCGLVSRTPGRAAPPSRGRGGSRNRGGRREGPPPPRWGGGGPPLARATRARRGGSPRAPCARIRRRGRHGRAGASDTDSWADVAEAGERDPGDLSVRPGQELRSDARSTTST